MSSKAHALKVIEGGANAPVEALEGPQRVHKALAAPHTGLLGFFETVLRKFTVVVHAVTMLPMYLIGSVCIGLAITPGLYFYQSVSDATARWPQWAHYPAASIAFAMGYFIYGFSLILIVPAVNFLLRANITPWRGSYYSIATVRWYVHNGLTYLVRYTFLEFVTPTPFNLLFFKLMGMKIGRGTQINTVNISDPSLIEMGEKVTIGGSATIIAHYGQGGVLVIAPTKIESGATIGLKATIMGGVEIGAGAKIMPNSVVLPKTKIPAGETWGGVPAAKITR